MVVREEKQKLYLRLFRNCLHRVRKEEKYS